MSTTANVTAQITRSDTSETVGGLEQLTVADHKQAGIIGIGTSEETLAIGADIVNAGLMYLKNHDSDNYVEIGWATGVYYLRLEAGEIGLVPLQPSASTLYLKANTAEVLLQYEITERT